MTNMENLGSRVNGIDGFWEFSTVDRNQSFYTRNLDALAGRFTNLAKTLQQVKNPQSKLLVNSDGDFDIFYGGKPVFGQGSQDWARQRIENFELKGGAYRIFNEPGQFEGIEGNAIRRMAYEASMQNISFSKAPRDSDCFHLIVFGVALADHLPLMIERTNCQNLILIEPNLEFLYHSLFTFDWAKMFSEFDSNNQTISIILDFDPERISLTIRESIRETGPHMMDAATLLVSYPDPVLEAAALSTRRSANLILSGLSFFEDECEMMRNAYLNLRHYQGHYYKRRTELVPFPAFVVGSGPSLDTCFDVIRKNQDNAVIISCGTTISLLLREGITPDFQVEMENTREIVDCAAAVSQLYDLSGVTLVASNTVNPGIGQRFGRTIYYFRSNLASAAVFSLGEDTNISLAVPTVANLGLSLAQELGCREFHVFGVDLGARDLEHHHAKGSLYESGEAPYRSTLDIAARANFGGANIWTDRIFIWAREMLEVAAANYPFGRRYYNSSDGLRIAGFNPCLADTINVTTKSGKQDYLELAISEFPKYSQVQFFQSWKDSNLINNILAMRDALLACIGSSEKVDPWVIMQQVHHIVSPRDVAFRAENHFFQGTLCICLGSLNYYVNRVASESQRLEMLDIGKRELVSVIHLITNRVIALCAELEAEDQAPKPTP